MNKPYFTKYIPVEGEIKEGDYVRRQNSGKVGGPCTDISLLILDKHDHKVKLFLCSRDIQVGDHFINPNWEGKIVKEGIDIVADEEDMEYLKSVGCYKLIGEVSPNAIWVKEGMEFDEPNEGYYRGDFQVLPIYGDDKNVTFLGSHKQLQAVINQISPRELRVLFKCPTCSTFH